MKKDITDAEREGFKRAFRNARALMDIEVKRELFVFPQLSHDERKVFIFGEDAPRMRANPRKSTGIYHGEQ